MGTDPLTTQPRPGWTVYALIATAVLAVLGGVGYMVYSTLASGDALEYFKEVDRALAEIDLLRGRRVRLHGNVVAGTIQKQPGSLSYRFALFHGDEWTDVAYRGIVPDTLRDCAEVVVKGRFASVDGRLFDADKVIGKCPSKYEEQQHTTGCGEALRGAVARRRQRAGPSD